MDDLISRQAAITAIQNAYCDTEGGEDKCAVWKNIGLTNALHIMQDLPSAQPERKGRWIKLDMHAHLADHKCTACGQECYVPTCMGEPMYTYCPNCGADMREQP